MRSETIYRTKSNQQSTISIPEKYEATYKKIRENLWRNNLSQGVFFVQSWEENFEGLPQNEINTRLKAMRFGR